ncbi:MAG: DUF1292 domain-containing protein [Lachnospiraceae bacterium]|nr:DUF1292 domain-containing protein [Lachnospiraceae bacterium]
MSETKKEDALAQIRADEELVTLDVYHDDGYTTCIVAAILTIPESARRYVALLPVDEHGEYSPENAWFYRYVTDETNPDAEPDIENITDDEELESVIDRYDEYLDEIAFDELLSEEEDA